MGEDTDMTTFDDREDRFENEFVHNAEIRFKVRARRDKLIGLWAAGKLGLDGAEAEDYAATVVLADIEEPGDEDVFRKLRADLDGARKPVSDEEIRGQLADLLPIAKAQFRAGT